MINYLVVNQYRESPLYAPYQWHIRYSATINMGNGEVENYLVDAIMEKGDMLRFVMPKLAGTFGNKMVKIHPSVYSC